MPYERKTFDLFISDEMRKVLSEFESDSLVAQLLLKKRIEKDVLVDDPVNFISFSRDDKSKISYLTSDRIANLEGEVHWTTSRRFHCKPGGFIGKLFKNVPAKEVEKFSNLIRTYANKPQFKFEVIQGGRIRDCYYYENYSAERGSLGSSCMKHESCQRFFDLYTKNTDVCKMLVMTDSENRIMGRAILWTFESYKIMDRIYTVNDEALQFYFKKWATDNGYLHKNGQNWFNTLLFEQAGDKKQELKLCIKIDCRQYNRLPYLDTFKFMDCETGWLYNYQPNKNNHRVLTSSDGSYNDYDSLKFDSLDRVFRYRSEACLLRYIGDDFYTHQSNCQWSNVNDQYILGKDSTYMEEIEDYIFVEEYDQFNNKEGIERIKKHYEDMRSQSSKRRKSNRLFQEMMNTLTINGLNIHSSMGQSLVEQVTQLAQEMDEQALEPDNTELGF